MYNFKMELEAMLPLKMNKHPGIMTRKAGKPKSEEDLLKDAEPMIYRDPKGQISVESKALKACGARGAAMMKVSKRSFRQEFRGQIRFNDLFFPLLDEKNKPYSKPTGYHRDLVRQPPRTGVLVPKIWPYFDKWRLAPNGYVIDDEISIDILKEAFVIGGKVFGLLDGRPDWGLFTVKKIEKI
jgi:hypothetical protein